MGCCLRATYRYLALAGVEIRGIEIRIALPEERRFTHVVARREWLRILPNTTNADMVLEVLADARKVLQAAINDSGQR